MWLNNNITDIEVNINEYSFESNDRNSCGGGIAPYIKNGMKNERKYHDSPGRLCGRLSILNCVALRCVLCCCFIVLYYWGFLLVLRW